MKRLNQRKIKRNLAILKLTMLGRRTFAVGSSISKFVPVRPPVRGHA